MKLLIIEDDPSLLESMRDYFTALRWRVESAGDYSAALRKVEDHRYDCVLLEQTLRGGGWTELLRSIQASPLAPGVVIISASHALEDKLLALELGADDYLCKPFHRAELAARVRNLVRRREPGGGHILRYGNVELFPDDYRVLVGGEPLKLSRKEFDILRYFLARPLHIIDKVALAEAIWGDHADQADNFDFIYAQVKNLRKRLSQAGADITIRSVYGFGYKLTLKNIPS